MRLPHGHRPPPPCLHLLLFTALCFVILKTAAAGPRTGSTGEGGIASVTRIMGTEVKDSLKQEPVSGVIALKESMKYFDADFFNDSKLRELEDGATEFNLPAFRENRKLVALENGGLHNPSVLVFKSSWSGKTKAKDSKRFNYPHTSSVHRPSNDEDISFMSILELGELIRTKKITSRELTDVFLRRLKRHSTVLESVIMCTEDLAYKEAKEADDLLEQGKYLAM